MASRFGPQVDALLKDFVDIASAATTDLATVTENVRITGTVTITSFGSNVKAGAHRWIRFAGALTLTHNGTSLLLPGGANITTAANDRCEAVSLGGGNWIVSVYQRANGTAPAATASYTVSNLPANGAGQVAYCSDCLSPRGTGGLVFNDGSNWRLSDTGAVATTGIDTYLNSIFLTGRVIGDGPYDAGWIDRFAGPASSTIGTNILRTMTQTGAGASITTSGVAVAGAAGVLFFTSGTTATGVVGWRSASFDVVNQAYDLMLEVVFNLTALSTASDEYWFLFGLTDNGTSGSTADANIVAFLYDRAATWGAGGTNTKWKLITRKTGVGTTLTDSTVTVATGTHSLRIYRNAAGTTVRFFLDGVQVGGDVSTNLPASGSQLRIGCDMQNTAHAGGAVNANQISVGYAVRRTSALFT